MHKGTEVNKLIQVGDLVIVVKWPCCGARLGAIRTVKSFRHVSGLKCCKCLADHVGYFAYLDDGECPVEWLKRIPPIEGLESTDETTKETA